MQKFRHFFLEKSSSYTPCFFAPSTSKSRQQKAWTLKHRSAPSQNFYLQLSTCTCIFLKSTCKIATCTCSFPKSTCNLQLALAVFWNLLANLQLALAIFKNLLATCTCNIASCKLHLFALSVIFQLLVIIEKKRNIVFPIFPTLVFGHL